MYPPLIRFIMIHNSPPGYDTKGANVKHKKYEKGRVGMLQESRRGADGRRFAIITKSALSLAYVRIDY